jgi:archaellum component FlaG (FlaF/FlaG flagellin family)
MSLKAPLKSLHSEGSLSQPKLVTYRKLSTEELVGSLCPGELGALKVKPDGTIMDGHHRVCVLRERGVDVDALPREVLE